jgi:hypothetical protein
MSEGVDEGDFIKIGSTLEGDDWLVTAELGDTTIMIETTRDDVDSLPVLVNSMSTILDTAWSAIEEQLNQEAP